MFIRYNPIYFERSYGEHDKFLSNIIWFNIITGRTETKRIKVSGVRISDIKELMEFWDYSRHGKFLEWQKLHREEY